MSEIRRTALYSDASLQGYWRLETDGTDSSANGYNVSGTAPTYTTGRYGNGGDFEASSSQYLAIAGSSSANLNITGSQTWSAWVKLEGLATNGRIMCRKHNAKELVVGTDGGVLMQHAGLSAFQ